MWERILRWYEGETKVHENDPNSEIVIIGVYQEYHWTAKVMHKLVNWMKVFPPAKLYYLLGVIAFIYAGISWLRS